MTKTKSTKRSLLLSLLSLVICITMLIGTTYAWFTDSVSSMNNIIKSGNLDVDLEYYDGDSWEKVTADTKLFDQNALWEPGYTEVVYLKVSNIGSLALKYQLGINIINETIGTNVADEPLKLSDYIEFGAIEGETATIYDSREEARKAVTDAKTISEGFLKSSSINAGDPSEYVALVVYMPETVGNEANYKTGTVAPEINIGVNLVATQFTNESDSFGIDYDEDATYVTPWNASADTSWYTGDKTTYTLYTAEELAGLATLVNAGNSFTGITVNLGADMDLGNLPWTPIGIDVAPFGGTLDGNHYVISNLVINGDSNVGLVGNAGNSASIENITIENATVSGNHYVGTVLGYGYLSANSLAGCVVNNATVVCTPDENNDNGDKAGIIAGLAINGNIYNNKVTNSTIYAYRDFGTIVGMAQAENRDIKVYSNSAKNVEMFYITCDSYAGSKPNANMGELVGRLNHAGKTVTVASNNIAKDIVKNDAVNVAEPDDGITASANETVYLAPGTYTDIKSIGAGATIIGTEGVVINDTLSGTLNNTTIKNVEIKAPNAQRWAYSQGDLLFEDCTFEATSIYAIHYDGLNGANITYKNCKIVGWAAIGSGAEHITFDNCEIYGNGRYGVIRLYSPGTIKNCYFDVSAVNTTDIYQDGIHAVDCTITVENTVNANGKVEDLFNISGTGVIKNGDVSNVASADALNAALAAGGDVLLTDDVTTEATTTAPYGNKVGFVHNGGVFDGNGNTISVTNYGDEYAVMTTGGTIKNVEVDEGFRGIMIMNPTQDIVLDNVKVGGDVCYALNTGEGDGTHKLIVTNSTLNGWTSIGTAVASASFTNCTFGQGEYYTDVFGRVVKPYVNTVFDSCEFNSKFYIDLSQLGKDGDGKVLDPDAKITLKNCTVNGVKLTAENWKELIVSEGDCGEGQISVESKDGTYMTASNVLDYVIIE